MNDSTNIPNLMQSSWLWLARNLTNTPNFTAYFEPLVQFILPQWRADRLLCRVMDIRIESSDMYSLVIKPNKKWHDFSAGQYVELTSVKNGAWMSRYFSLSSSPAYFKKTGLIEISIRIQENGQMTPWLLHALKFGSVVNLSQASGEFCLDQVSDPVLMIAGGSGITPFRSMLQQIALSGQAVTKSVSLMYYARSTEHFLFREELKKVEQQTPNLTVYFIDTSDVGFFSDAHLFTYCDDYISRDIYVCGPSQMILHVRKILQNLEVKDSQIHYEFFGPEPVVIEGYDQTTSVLFQQSGKQVTVEKGEIKTLLALAEDAQLKPVTGCRIGVCHQCICKKKSGVVYNSKTKTYSDTGQEDIQLCVSVPVADVVLSL
jgi:ferredoxin-NADP reductase